MASSPTSLPPAAEVTPAAAASPGMCAVLGNTEELTVRFQLDALGDDEATAVLRLASVEARGRLACASRRWRALALAPALWAGLRLEDVLARVNHDAIRALLRTHKNQEGLLSVATANLGSVVRLPASVVSPALMRQALCSVTYLRPLVQRALREVLGEGNGADVAGDELLMDLGIDSLGAVELVNKLQSSLGMELPSTLIFDYPTVDSIVQYLGEQVY